MREMMNANEQAAKTKKWAWALIASAFLIPLLASVVAGENLGFQAGHAVGYYGGALVAALLITSLATAKRTPLVKARGDLCAGILLIGLSISTTYTEWHEREGMKDAIGDLASVIRQSSTQEAQSAPTVISLPDSTRTAGPSSSSDEAYLRGLTAMVRSQTAEIAAIRQQAQVIDLSPILAPKTLTDKEQIGAAKERLNGYKRLLLAERAAVEKNHVNAERYMRTTPATAAFKTQAIAGFERSKGGVAEAYGAYHGAEMRIVAITEALLAFASSHNETMKLAGDQLLFDAQTDLDAYNAMLVELQAAAVQEEIATKNLARVVSQSQGDHEALAKLSK